MWQKYNEFIVPQNDEVMSQDVDSLSDNYDYVLSYFELS